MEDEQIVQLFWQRSESALVQMEQKYGKLLYKLASGILLDSRDAEEATADTYFRLWNSIPPKHPAHLLAYSARICRNVALDILRKNQREKRDRRAEILFSELEECLATEDILLQRLENRELMEYINRYLATLDQISRILFVRRYFSMEELDVLADNFGMTKHVVSARLYRIRRGLKQYLKKEGINL